MRELFSLPQFLITAGFTIIYHLYERWLFPTQVLSIQERLSRPEQLLAQALSFLLVYAYIWFSLASRGGMRFLYLALFAFSVLAEYGALFSMKRFSIAEDYYMVLKLLDPRLWKNAVGGYSGTLWLGAAPILGYAACLYGFRQEDKLGAFPFVAVLVLTFAFYSLLYPFSSGVFRTSSFNASLRSWSFLFWRIAFVYRGPRLAIEPLAHKPPENNVVFIIDESIRGDKLSLNGYFRPTTPYLEELQRQGYLYNWSDSAACATASLNSNALLLTGINQLPDVAQNTRKMPTIFDYARAMGYRTYNLDVQVNTRWLISSEEYQHLDGWLKAEDFAQGAEYEIDANAARWMAEKLRSSTGNFIWINKMGVHFPYSSRFPHAEAAWRPFLDGKELDPARQNEMANAYDNALTYNLENFFRQLVQPDTLANTTFIYVSDHGQTIGENGATWPHVGPTHNEAIVPIFIITAQPLAVDTTFRASHQHVFATLLDFMGFPEEKRIYPYAPSLLKTTADQPWPRFYIVGDITSALRGELYDFDE